MPEYLPIFDAKLNAELETNTEHDFRLLGALGLYDASLDDYEVTEHPEDNQWIVRGTE